MPWSEVSAGFESTAYRTHVREFADDFCTAVGQAIVTAYQTDRLRMTAHCEEVLQQLHAVQEKAEGYLGDLGVVPAVLQHLKSSRSEQENSGITTCFPMVVAGASGCGEWRTR